MPNHNLLKSSTLRAIVDERARAALACGALRPIETEHEVVEDGGVRFVVRLVSSLRRKEAEKRRHDVAVAAQGAPPNPFMPPEPDLTVAPISRTHLAVLNKFNVLDGHLLIVTRRFAHQETLLDVGDFHALFACMAQYDGLGFYNGGVVAGASQPHKHLQLVPLPLAREGLPVPLEPLLTGSGPRCPALPFPHGFCRLGDAIRDNFVQAADQAHSLYLHLLAELGIGMVRHNGDPRQSAPYNLLIAHDWMLAVPRRQEFFEGISVNALGFAGSLFVKNRDQLDLVRRAGPMHILQAVSGRT